MELIETKTMESYKRMEMIAFHIDTHNIQDADIKVYVANNGFDESPTWEDATNELLTDDLYYFTNEIKTADKWGVKVKIEINK